MLPNFLFPEQAVTANAEGPPLDVTDYAGSIVQLTLGITEIIEQESLDVAVFGSSNGAEWSVKPITAFPQKFYTGLYTILLDLSQTPDIRFLKVKYAMNRWGHWATGPAFTFFVFAEPLSLTAG